MTRSVTTRLTLLFASVSTAVLLLLGLLVGALVERHFEEMDSDLLDGKLELVRHAIAGAQDAGGWTALQTRLDAALVGHHGLSVAIWSAAGDAVYVTAGAEFPAALRLAPSVPGGRPEKWSAADGRLQRGVSARASTGVASAAPLVIAVSTDLSHHEHFMASFRVALWSVVVVAALVSGALGWLVARKGLAPLRAICREAAGITADRLDRRLAADTVPPELAEVAQTLNAMLARLEESFRRLSDFSSDLAHELRTPVSNLLTQTQVTLSRARPLPEYQEVLASNVEELERLSRTIADMLFLAKADSDLLIPNRERVDLAHEVASLCEFYEPLAEEKQLALRCSGAAFVTGDRLMLRRAIANLLANALHHAPRQGHVAVYVEEFAGMAQVGVDNDGEAIAAEHLPRLFDRFYRADPSRQQGAEGSGLGLAITRSIARTHGGEVSVCSDAQSTRFQLRLPSSS